MFKNMINAPAFGRRIALFTAEAGREMTGDNKIRQKAYRIETGRLLLRCWSPADAPVLRKALDDCDQHLRPYIPFMKDEPRSLDDTAQWLRGHRAAFDLDQMLRYAVFDRNGETLLGENMLLSRVGPGGLEIGYWIHKDAIGRGFATESTAVLTRVAFELEGMDRVEIFCAPENLASACIPAKLGFTHEATVRRRAHDANGELCDLMIWSLFAEDLTASPAASVNYTAYDCMGRQIR
jgi:RimJ/RimL family protein N-acetyltransferase